MLKSAFFSLTFRIAQVPFLNHETTATSTAWPIFAMPRSATASPALRQAQWPQTICRNLLYGHRLSVCHGDWCRDLRQLIDGGWLTMHGLHGRSAASHLGHGHGVYRRSFCQYLRQPSHEKIAFATRPCSEFSIVAFGYQRAIQLLVDCSLPRKPVLEQAPLCSVNSSCWLYFVHGACAGPQLWVLVLHLAEQVLVETSLVGCLPAPLQTMFDAVPETKDYIWRQHVIFC